MKKISLSPMLTGHLLALAATIAWSGIYVLSRGMAGSMTPLEVSFWRWLVALVALLPFAGRSLYTHASIICKSWKPLFWISLPGVMGFSFFLFLAGETASATTMSLIAASAPVFMALMSRFFLNQPLSRKQATGLLIAICGVIMLITRGDIVHLFSLSLTQGDLWMLLAAGCFASYSILIVRLRPKDLPQMPFLGAIMLFGCLQMVPFLLYQWIVVAPPALPQPATLSGILYVGVVASTCAFLCWNFAIERIGAIRAGVVYYSIPLFSSILAVMFLNETVLVSQVFGGIFIIGGILFSSFGKKEPHRDCVCEK